VQQAPGLTVTWPSLVSGKIKTGEKIAITFLFNYSAVHDMEEVLGDAVYTSLTFKCSPKESLSFVYPSIYLSV